MALITNTFIKVLEVIINNGVANFSTIPSEKFSVFSFQISGGGLKNTNLMDLGLMESLQCFTKIMVKLFGLLLIKKGFQKGFLVIMKSTSVRMLTRKVFYT